MLFHIPLVHSVRIIEWAPCWTLEIQASVVGKTDAMEKLHHMVIHFQAEVNLEYFLQTRIP